MSLKLLVSAELEVIEANQMYYAYDKYRNCLCSATSVTKLKEMVTTAFRNALKIDVEVKCGSTTAVKTEPLNHIGKNL